MGDMLKATICCALFAVASATNATNTTNATANVTAPANATTTAPGDATTAAATTAPAANTTTAAGNTTTAAANTTTAAATTTKKVTTTAASAATTTAAAAANVTAAKDQVTVVLTSTLEFATELSTEDLAKAETEFCDIAKKESGTAPSFCTLTKAARRRLLAVKYTGSVSYVVEEKAVAALKEVYEGNTFADAVVASEEFKTINGGTALAKPTITVAAIQNGKEYTPATTKAADNEFSSASALIVGVGAALAIFL